MENSKNTSRRSFLTKSAIAAAGISLFKGFQFNTARAEVYSTPVFNGLLPEGGTFTLPALDYAYTALEPYIDARTMEIHHTKHHQTYVTKLNEALDKAPELKEKSLTDLITNINALPESVRQAVRNHGGGHFNHSMFWKLMSPDAANAKASDELAAAITAKWTSFDNFKAEFSKTATGVFGSGWAWLVKDGSSIAISSSPNQDTPIMEGKKVVLGLDVWEHAYYLKYQNRRPDYLDAWWNVVNWDAVAQNYAAARK
jgi:Fe-Mn family superoxide dismutase